MKYLTLSLENVKRDCKELSDHIKKSEYNPTCVVYIKTGGYLVGKGVAEELSLPYSGFRLSRKGTSSKEKLSFIIKFIPKPIKNLLRTIEVKSNIHEKNFERIVTEDEGLEIYGDRILLIDDSIDTGNSSFMAVNYLKKRFGQDIKIKVCSLNKFKQSDKKIKTDFYLYEDTIINYPWSKDSKYYKEFIQCYNSR